MKALQEDKWQKIFFLLGRPIVYLENNMKMSIGGAISSCIDNEMLLKPSIQIMINMMQNPSKG